MWPWSTISRLKDELRRTKGDRDFWNRQAQAANDRAVTIAAGAKEMKVRYDEVAERAAALEDARLAAVSAGERHAQQVKVLEAKVASLMQDKMNLQARLAKAVVRDPKTGRLMKPELTTGFESGRA